MSRRALEWLASRTPAAPDALRRAMERQLGRGGEEADLVAVLGGSGCRALERAVAHPARERDTALALLAADALLTYACEAAADVENVAAALEHVLNGVSDVGR